VDLAEEHVPDDPPELRELVGRRTAHVKSVIFNVAANDSTVRHVHIDELNELLNRPHHPLDTRPLVLEHRELLPVRGLLAVRHPPERIPVAELPARGDHHRRRPGQTRVNPEHVRDDRQDGTRVPSCDETRVRPLAPLLVTRTSTHAVTSRPTDCSRSTSTASQ